MTSESSEIIPGVDHLVVIFLDDGKIMHHEREGEEGEEGKKFQSSDVILCPRSILTEHELHLAVVLDYGGE